MDRVLGAGPFREVGRPLVVDHGPGSGLVVIGGELPQPRWPGRDLSGPERHGGHRYPLAVFRADDLRCVHLLYTAWPANAIARHPVLPLAVVGTGVYDGGFFYKGELLLLNLTTGAVVSLLDGREIREVSWRDPRTLDLVVSITCDNDYGTHGSKSLTCAIRRDDWDRATVGMIEVPSLAYPVADKPRDSSAAMAAAADEVQRIARDGGLSWTPRCAVWAAEGLTDGRILAALEGVALECWSSASGEPQWRLTADATGHQIKVFPDERTALALAQPPNRFDGWAWTTEADLDTGAVRRIRRPPFPAVMMSRADGAWALRDVEPDVLHSPKGDPHPTRLYRPDGELAATAALDRYDPTSDFFDIRNAPDLLFLNGVGQHRQVVTVDVPEGRVRPLFPYDWDRTRDAQLTGGCGAYLKDRSGAAIVHTGQIRDGAGSPGTAFVVRRAYPSGAVQWVLTAGGRATALDIADDLVLVAFDCGELVMLDAADGSLRARQELRVGGHLVVPLSLARIGPGRIAIGTLDGLILDCSVVAENAA